MERRAVEELKWRWLMAVGLGAAGWEDREWLEDAAAFWERMASMTTDRLWREETRHLALQGLALVLSPAQSQRCADALRPMAMRDQEVDDQARILAAWSRHADPSYAAWAIEQLGNASPRLRAELLSGMLRMADRREALLQAVERSKISLRILDPVQVQLWRQSLTESQRGRWDALAPVPTVERQSIIDRYAASLEGAFDREHGRALFRQHCAACHVVEGVGTAIGPDISDSRTQTPMQLLVAILDPNRAIDNRYFRVVVRMQDGAVHDGLVIEESSQHLVLSHPNAGRVVLSRREVETVQGTGTSLMPEGLEGQIDERSMADLIGYLKHWRYRGGETPKIPSP
jgi:putative heme-binding domain-containing protein